MIIRIPNESESIGGEDKDEDGDRESGFTETVP